MPPLESSPYRLLVEGVDDRHTIVHLLKRHGYDWDDERSARPFVEDCRGVTNVLRALPVALKASYDRVGVVLDADDDVARRWRSLHEKAAHAGIALPPQPPPDGAIVHGLREGSRVGFWLMPDNRQTGRLEDFVSALVPADDTCWPFADEATHEARRRGAKCRESAHLKSALHTWLAWQEEPGVPFGTALKSHYLRHDSEAAQRFVTWFRRLFE